MPMPTPETTVLLTCAASPMSVESIIALQESRTVKARVVGVDMDAQAVGRAFASAFYAVPAGADPGYSEQLMAICRKEGVQVVIPTSDEEALALARHAEDFKARGIVCTVPPMEHLERFADKAKMYAYLAQQGLPVPPHRCVSTLQDLRQAAAELGYPQTPVVIKPVSARGGRGVWLLRPQGSSLQDLTGGMSLEAITLETFTESAERAGSMPAMLVMQALAGDVFDVDLLGCDGRLLASVARRRFHPRTTPFRGCVLEQHEGVLDLARRAHAALGLSYLQDVDVMLDGRGQPHLLEVNPRQSGSVITTVAAGLNLLELLVRVALSLDVPEPIEIPYGIAVRPSVRTTCSRQAVPA
jgi:carbamoyl-phosphate synthase large subunit